MGSLSRQETVTLGVDIGKKRDPTALCVAETQDRSVNERNVTHFLIRHLERLPLETPYFQVVERIDAIATALQKRTGVQPVVYVEATGVGLPIVDLLQETRKRARSLVAVTFTSGKKRQLHDGDPMRLILGKEYLTCRLQALLASRRIHLPSSPEGRALAAELSHYELRIDRRGHARFGAFRADNHDDLTTALGLAIC